MTKLDEGLLDAIEGIIFEKASTNKAPALCCKMELYAKVSGSLNKLYKAGKIKVGDTINDKWITIPDAAKNIP